MKHESWYHLAAALVSAGVSEAQAEQFAKLAILAPKPMLALAAALDNVNASIAMLQREANALEKVIRSNREPGDEGEAFVRSVVGR